MNCLFENTENIYRYGVLVNAYLQSFPKNIEECNYLVATGTNDVTTSPGSSRIISNIIPNAKPIEINSSDHFMLYGSEERRGVVTDNLMEQEIA